MVASFRRLKNVIVRPITSLSTPPRITASAGVVLPWRSIKSRIDISPEKFAVLEYEQRIAMGKVRVKPGVRYRSDPKWKDNVLIVVNGKIARLSDSLSL